MALRRPPKKTSETAPEEPAVPSAAKATTTPLKTRRRPTLIALGLALIAVCALGTWWLVDQTSTTNQVVVAARNVPTGTVLADDDLTTIDANIPSNASTIPGSQKSSLIGKRSNGPLPKGAILAPKDLSADAFPAQGTAVVGIKVMPGQAPSSNLKPGDHVQVVGTPRPNDDPPTSEAPAISGVVQAISEPTNDGSRIIDITVNEKDSGSLAGLSATGRINVVLVSQKEG